MNRTISSTRKNSHASKQWIHANESLSKCSVIYIVKFLGHVEVDRPKGSDVVKDAIRKMKFNKQLKRAEGQKCAKVELSISIRSISILDPKSKMTMFKYPLHLVSYCADDKSDKRMFSFIAKDKTSDKHQCFVFDSERSAIDITMTLGQAFELAYQHFLDSTSKNGDMKNQLISCHKKIRELTEENSSLKQRVTLVEKLLESKDLTLSLPVANHNTTLTNGHSENRQTPPINGNGVGAHDDDLWTTEENLSNGNYNNGKHSNGRHSIAALPILSPPPPIPNRKNSVPVTSVNGSASPNNDMLDIFGARPFSPVTPAFLPTNPFSPPPTFSPQSSVSSPINESYPYYSPVTSNSDECADDPFGLGSFGTSSYNEREFLDMQVNLSRGLAFDTEDFSLDDLDPLKK